MAITLCPVKLSLLEPKQVSNLARLVADDVDTDSPEVACAAVAVALFQVCTKHKADMNMVMATARNLYGASECKH